MSQHIILLQGMESDETFTYIATELCDFNVKQWLDEEEVKQLNAKDWSKQAAGFVKDILSGLHHLHTLSIVHRDIKVQHIFILYYMRIFLYI